MSYCHKCGEKNKEKDDFCAHCGTKIKDFIEDTEEEAEEIVQRTSYAGFIFFILIIILIGYLVLDIWAVSQLTPVLTLNGVVSSISNFQGGVSLSQTSVSSTIRVENPTFVPILFGRISYIAGYGDTQIAEGKTGLFVMSPNSQQDIPVDLTINNLNAVKSGLKGIWNTLTGQTEKAYLNIYADFGIIKFKIKSL